MSTIYVLFSMPQTRSLSIFFIRRKFDRSKWEWGKWLNPNLHFTHICSYRHLGVKSCSNYFHPFWCRVLLSARNLITADIDSLHWLIRSHCLCANNTFACANCFKTKLSTFRFYCRELTKNGLNWEKAGNRLINQQFKLFKRILINIINVFAMNGNDFKKFIISLEWIVCQRYELKLLD